MAPMPPCPAARSTSSRIRFLSSALNLRRSGLAATSGSGELATKGTAILVSLTMILLAALLCNYGRGKCLIIIGTEGSREELLQDVRLAQVVVGCDDARKRTPRIGVQPKSPLNSMRLGAVDQIEVERKLRLHLALPLLRERSWRENQDP